MAKSAYVPGDLCRLLGHICFWYSLSCFLNILNLNSALIRIKKILTIIYLFRYNYLFSNTTQRIPKIYIQIKILKLFIKISIFIIIVKFLILTDIKLNIKHKYSSPIKSDHVKYSLVKK